MKQLKYSFLIFAVIIIMVQLACQQKSEFIIEGKFHKLDPTPVELYLLQENATILVDSVFASNNTFSLKGAADHSSIYLLKFFNDQSIYLVIHPKDQIKLEIDNTMSEIAYYVENSPDSEYIRELTDQQNKVLRQINQLSYEWEKNRTDTVIRQKIDSTYFMLIKKHQKYTRNFIYEHPKSLANILAIYQNFGKKGTPLFDKYDDFDIFNYVDSMLTPIYSETETVLALNRSLSETRDQIRHNTLIEKKVEIGSPIPLVNMATITGDTLHIGTESDRVLLIVFWASWNKYSVEEVKFIQDFYVESRLQRKLDIFSISLDSSEEELLNCISEYNISLPVVCDYKYWDSELAARFVVKRIPSVILTDKHGKVIDRDIFSEELINRINETIE